MRTALAALALVVASGGAHAQGGWDAVRNACTSIDKQACMLKPETRICMTKGGTCRYIGIDNYVAVREIRGSRLILDTVYGRASAPLSGLVFLPEE